MILGFLFSDFHISCLWRNGPANSSMWIFLAASKSMLQMTEEEHNTTVDIKSIQPPGSPSLFTVSSFLLYLQVNIQEAELKLSVFKEIIY